MSHATTQPKQTSGYTRHKFTRSSLYRFPVVAALLAACLTGCTHTDEDPDTTQTTSGDAPATAAETSSEVSAADSESGKAALSALLTAPRPTPSIIATGTGHPKSQNPSDAVDVTAHIVSVIAREHDTILNWTIHSTNGAESNWSSFSPFGYGYPVRTPFSSASRMTHRADAVNLEAPSAGLMLSPLMRPQIALTDDDMSDSNGRPVTMCLCSQTPSVLNGTPYPMQGYYPKLPDGTTTVNLHIPGFEPITNIPVTQST